MTFYQEHFKSRDELRQRLIEAFSSQDEIYQICFFGREVEGKHDCYSDIDMVVRSNDLALTKAKYQDIFSSISPIRATLRLAEKINGYSEMVLLEDFSPYQKVDFSISDWGKQDWQFIVVYDSQDKPRINQSKLEDIPIKRDVRYLLTDVLFSVARFTKCLFRRDIDMYRRWASITDITLALLYEKHLGWRAETVKTRLGSFETGRLYPVLDPGEKKELDCIRPPDAKLAVASSYQASIELFIELSRCKAEYFSIVLDDDLIEYITRFMVVEIKRFQEHG
jgi:predicted nucleotidyltransferase